MKTLDLAIFLSGTLGWQLHGEPRSSQGENVPQILRQMAGCFQVTEGLGARAV